MVGLLIVASKDWHGKHSLDHDLAGVQKFHTRAVPRIGGLAVVSGVSLTPFFLEMLVAPSSTTLFTVPVLKLVLASLPAFGAGIVEDLTKQVSVKTRLAATIVSALVGSWLLGATMETVNIWGVDSLFKFGPLALFATAFMVAGNANAINIIDGFNGLAASVVVIMQISLGVLAWQTGDELVLLLALLGGGATLGFFVINFPTGGLFLGDGGAYFIGFWCAEMAVLLLVRNPSVNAWQVLSVCAYPVIEVLFSIYRRKFVRKASPGAPDGLHLHTLLYRRFVVRYCRANVYAPWVRNASVCCVVAPCIALFAMTTILFGKSVIGAILLVLLQVLSYVLVYQRLVRGNWRRKAGRARQVVPAGNAKLS